MENTTIKQIMINVVVDLIPLDSMSINSLLEKVIRKYTGDFKTISRLSFREILNKKNRLIKWKWSKRKLHTLIFSRSINRF